MLTPDEDDESFYLSEFSDNFTEEASAASDTDCSEFSGMDYQTVAGPECPDVEILFEAGPSPRTPTIKLEKLSTHEVSTPIVQDPVGIDKTPQLKTDSEVSVKFVKEEPKELSLDQLTKSLKNRLNIRTRQSPYSSGRIDGAGIDTGLKKMKIKKEKLDKGVGIPLIDLCKSDAENEESSEMRDRKTPAKKPKIHCACYLKYHYPTLDLGLSDDDEYEKVAQKRFRKTDGQYLPNQNVDLGLPQRFPSYMPNFELPHKLRGDSTWFSGSVFQPEQDSPRTLSLKGMSCLPRLPPGSSESTFLFHHQPIELKVRQEKLRLELKLTWTFDELASFFPSRFQLFMCSKKLEGPDPVDWFLVDTVQASKSPASCQLTDIDPFDTNFFVMRFVDIDGKFGAFSNVAKFQFAIHVK